MTGKTHLNGGLLASLLLCGNYIEGLLVVLGSLLPDIDHSSSTLGKSFPIISKTFSHRGFTHSLVFAIIAYFISPWLAIGILVHIFLDMLTTQGVKLLYPWDKKIRFPLCGSIKTNGIFEKILFFLLTIANAALIGLKFV